MPLSRLRLFLVPTLLLLLSAPSLRAERSQLVASQNDPEIIAVPLLQGSQGQPLLRGQINGKDAILYVDTGAPVTCVDESKARRFEFPALEWSDKTQITVNANGADHRVTLISNLRLGALRIENTPAVLIDFRELNRAIRATRDRPNDAILGLEILTALGAVIDFDASEILVKTHAGKATALGARLKASGWTEIPMRLNEGHFTVRATVNQTVTELIVDTGSPVSVLDRAFCKTHAVPLTRRTFSSRGIHFQDAAVQMGKIGSLKFGNAYRINNLPIAVFDLSRLLGLSRNINKMVPDGLLGCETLTHHHAYIDCENLKLYLRESG
jgi:predicted aspartyl protease